MEEWMGLMEWVEIVEVSMPQNTEVGGGRGE